MVSFIAPVVVRPGAIEMEALAYGALRVFNGEEEAHSYPPEKEKELIKMPIIKVMLSNSTSTSQRRRRRRCLASRE